MWSVLLSLAIAGHAFAYVADKGRVIELDGVSYYTGGTPIAQLDINNTGEALANAAPVSGGHDLFPLTIVEASSGNFSTEELVDIASEYEGLDDVFQRAFLETVYLEPPGDNASLSIDTTSIETSLDGLNVKLFITTGDITGDSIPVVASTITPALPKGPYFVSAYTGNVYKAYRLYHDNNLAFIQGVVSDEQGAYMSLPAITENVMAKSIAVPSRLYYKATKEQPLAGLRFGVKDIFHVKGVATSGGNRAYFYHYGPQNNTAPAVQRLIDLGAVLVGKMGTVQFANGDKATADWVDLHAPFNPRGDGYQDPSGSSTGPGAGIGAYEWLDLSIGSDTGGSMRGPAAAQGIFGNRPSTGAISLDHVIPLSPVADTAGLFARSGSLWAEATKAYYPNMQSNWTTLPKTLYSSPALSGALASDVNPVAVPMIESFVQKLGDFLGTEALPANYSQLWAETRGDAPAVDEMLNLTYAVFVSHDQWQLLGRPFFEDFAANNGGRKPYVNPGPLARWQWGQVNAPDEVYAEALRNISTFTEWYTTEGYGRRDPESCSESVYAYVFRSGQPSYRDEYFSASTTPPLGMSDSRVAVIAGAPEVIVPIGEVPYNSTKSLQVEYLPVSMALRMARGCDYVLASLVGKLEEQQIIQPVAAGSRLFP
ncbi:putative glutamyl-trna subunit a [Diaporthe ampelina]|uniref:Putative glutamyl-trna subunit a n=1 Tax=Diaporthe ampelina TaxID=1214573 RepID=A0A0G2FZ39_9PEZI|nr:putative glutamyl-trna subunit a [Diaporthe ampelina]